MTSPRRPTLKALGAIATTTCILCGCASSEVPRRSMSGAGDAGATGAAPSHAASQGGAWEAVFLPAMTAANLERAATSGGAGGAGAMAGWRGPEYARLDGDLPVRRESALLATSQWPAPARPSIERTRRIFLPDDAETALFFLPRRERWRHDPWDSWGGSWDRRSWP